LDVGDHVKGLLDTFVRDLGSFFQFLVVGVSVEAEDVERIIGCDSD
jgi:hypothetical protein